MTRVRRLSAAALAVVVTGCSGGARAPKAAAGSGGEASVTPAPAVAPRDTARGIISIVGSEPVNAVVLTERLGDDVVALDGDAADALLRALAGVEVMVAGVRTNARNRVASPRGAVVFRVESFVVRAVDGVAAVDGVLHGANGRYSLVLADGRELAIGALPPALSQHAGARVYLAGPLDRAPAAYGIIAGKP